MISIFHSLYCLMARLIKVWRKGKASYDFQNIDLVGYLRVHIRFIVTHAGEIHLKPSLWSLRYFTVQEILLNPHWKLNIKKVVLFGQLGFRFFDYIKFLYDIQEIIYVVDMDEFERKSDLAWLSLGTVDYLYPRPNVLRIQVLSGSCSQPDKRLAGCDALIAIEMIQKLYPDTLEGLPYNVFHHIQPLLVIFTIPNADFSVPLYPTEYHRNTENFAWTREQFQSWALNITARFPNYAVRFHGIAEDTDHYKRFGCCTQVAIFFRLSGVEKQSLNDENGNESYGICTYSNYVQQPEPFHDVKNGPNTYYNEIYFRKYPYKIDNCTPDERILRHVKTQLSASSRYYNKKTERIEYPLYELVSLRERGRFTTESELRTLLKKYGYKVEECDDSCYGTSQCVIYHPEGDGYTSESSSGDEHTYYYDSSSEAIEYNQSDNSSTASDRTADYPL